MLHSELRDHVAVLTLDDAITRGLLDEVVAAEALADAALAELDTATYAGIKRRLRAPTAHPTADSPGIELSAELGNRRP